LSSIRTEDSHVRTVFCDHLSETAQFFSYQVHVRTVFALTPFRVRMKTLEYSKMLDSVRTTCRDFPNSVDFWKPTQCRIMIDLLSGRCCSVVQRLQRNLLDIAGCPDTFKGSSKWLHRNRLIWLGICKESLWASSRSLWSVTLSE